MSNYHLTQEQVREIRDDLINTSIINSNTSALEDATNIINHALDKVLGAHVAEVKEFGLVIFLNKQNLKVGSKLYAPKGQS